MVDEGYIAPELRVILEEFGRIRDAYIGLKTYSEMQDEMLNVERERYEKMMENLEKLTKTCVLLENRNKSIIEKLQREKDDQRGTIESLKEQCDHLRLINTDQNKNDEEVQKLQEEMEILKAHLTLQESKYTEDIAVLKQQHSDEIQKYKMLLETAKREAGSIKSRGIGHSRNSVKRKNYSLFGWPELDVEKLNSSFKNKNEEDKEKGNINKKRKLFHESQTSEIDVT